MDARLLALIASDTPLTDDIVTRIAMHESARNALLRLLDRGAGDKAL